MLPLVLVHDAPPLQLLLEEFGKYEAGRRALFSKVYGAVAASASSGGPLKGSAFWQWYDQGQVRSAGEISQVASTPSGREVHVCNT